MLQYRELVTWLLEDQENKTLRLTQEQNYKEQLPPLGSGEQSKGIGVIGLRMLEEIQHRPLRLVAPGTFLVSWWIQFQLNRIIAVSSGGCRQHILKNLSEESSVKRPLTRCGNVKGTSKHLVKNLGTSNSRKQLPSSNLKGQVEGNVFTGAQKEQGRGPLIARLGRCQNLCKAGAGMRKYSTPSLGSSNAFHQPGPTRSHRARELDCITLQAQQSWRMDLGTKQTKPHIYLLCRQGLPGSQQNLSLY